MNYVCYDLTTGRIEQTGWVDEDYKETLINTGVPLVFVDECVDYKLFKVDLLSKQLVALTPEELLPPLIPEPIVVGLSGE